MATQHKEIAAFVDGTHNLIDDELIPDSAASQSLGWLTDDGKIELMYGKQAKGDAGGVGPIYGLHVGYKTDGTAVFFRKANTAVQYLNGDTWTNVITGLTASDMTFSNYSSLAGNFVYVSSPDDGIFKIVTANPGSYADMYDSTKNFKGYSLIDKGRMFMWNTSTDATGLYGSYIDSQDSDVYTTVSAEAIGTSGSTNYTGTLAFKAGGATRTCFGVSFTDGTQTITIDYTGGEDGTGDGDGTSTVNFMTGAYDITFDATTTGSVTASYQWEDSNANGVTDFTKSATRLAGEGFVLRQDSGGDAIQKVIPFDGSYFSMKERSVYQLTLDVDDTNPLNELIRTDVGISTSRAAVGTSTGIVFLNTGNPSKPMVNILKRNLVGDNFLTEVLFPQFSFEDYLYDDVLLDTWDKFVVIGCKEDSDENNRLLMCNMRENTVDVAPYGVRVSAKNAGYLYGGDPIAQIVYELFTGFDDMETKIDNEWIGKAETFEARHTLKRVKKLRLTGLISPQQNVKIYISRDDDEWQLVGTILGTADYVNDNQSVPIGNTYIGKTVVGGGDSTTNVFPFLMELKIRLGKFRSRRLKFVAQGFGYAAIQSVTDWDIWQYQNKIPPTYRVKQNVSLDGATTDQDSPTY